jgi:hypothetical protein
MFKRISDKNHIVNGFKKLDSLVFSVEINLTSISNPPLPPLKKGVRGI